MFRYFTLRTEQQLFCYLYGGALALFLTLLYPSFPAWASLSAPSTYIRSFMTK